MISPETRDFLLARKPAGSGEGIGLFHASPRDPIWEYVLSGLTAELCFDATEFRVSLIGHSHVALSFSRPDGEVATGTTRREGVELDVVGGALADQPGLDRPAARRRPARRLAAAGYGSQDRAVLPRRLRHRRRSGGDPGGEPAGLAR